MLPTVCLTTLTILVAGTLERQVHVPTHRVTQHPPLAPTSAGRAGDVPEPAPCGDGRDDPVREKREAQKRDQAHG